MIELRNAFLRVMWQVIFFEEPPLLLIMVNLNVLSNANIIVCNKNSRESRGFTAYTLEHIRAGSSMGPQRYAVLPLREAGW